MGGEVEKQDRDIGADSSLIFEDRLLGKELKNITTSFVKPSVATPAEGEVEKQDRDIGVDSSLILEDRLLGKELKNITTSFVKPSVATPAEKEWLTLSNLDAFWVPFYTPLLCIYTADQLSSPISSVVQHLKDSLADALVLFYPLAGRVATRNGGDGRATTILHCSDAGAVFTEADVDAKLVELKTEDFQSLPLLNGMVAAGLGSYPILPQHLPERPTLVVQVTRFTCGGITLAVNWSHAAADGLSGFHFMKSWSEIARGVEVSLLPDHRRQELTKPRIPPCATETPFKLLKTDKAQAMELQIQDSTVTVPGAAREDPKVVTLDDAQNSEEVVAKIRVDSKEEKPKTQMRVFEITKENVEHLKSVAAAPELTRADCVSAHLWRTIVRARDLPRDALVRLTVLMEGRKKLGLPPGYFGNVVGVTSTMATVDEVLSEPLTRLASLIHSSVSSVSRDYFLDFVDWIELKRDDFMSAMENLGWNREAGVSYLNRFPFYELDFGFGIPSYSTRNNLGAWDGLVQVVPGPRNSYDMVAMVNLNPEFMPNFANLVHEFPTT